MQEVSPADGTPSPNVNDDATPNSPDRAMTTTAPLVAHREALPQMDTLPPLPQSRIPEPPAKKQLPKMKVTTPIWLLAVAMFVLGLVIGVVVMRHRANAATIVASVNGTNITRDDLFNNMQDTSGAKTLHTMVQNILQLQFAQKKGLAPTQAQVDTEYAKMIQRPNFLQALAQSGISTGDFKYNLQVQLAETNVITQGITVSDTDVQKYYQQQSNPANLNAQFYRPEEISLRAIATDTQADSQKALSELAAQSPFELVASTYSKDPSATNGGQLAPLVMGRPPLHANPKLENEIFSMNVGSQIGPVFFDNKYWIFRCLAKAPAATVPFSQVQDQCLTGAKLQKGALVNGARIKQEFGDFQHTSSLQAFWPQYQSVVAAH